MRTVSAFQLNHPGAARYALLLFLLLLFVAPLPARTQNIPPFNEACQKAGNCPIGSRCDPNPTDKTMPKGNDQCASGDCEESTLEERGQSVWVCDCDEISIISDSESCAQRFGGTEDDWHCVDGTNVASDVSYGLDICQKDDDPSVVHFPIDPQNPNAINFLLSPSQSVVAEEIQGIIRAPQPRVRIPGLTFTDPEVIKRSARIESDGRTYIYMPYIGEYLAAAYRYAIVAGTVLVLIMFIVGGLDWVLAKDSGRIENAKKRFTRGTAGLLLLLSSYVLLYSINPELVEFRSLRLRYVDREEFDGSEATGEVPAAGIGNCGGAVGKKQKLFPGLDGTLHAFARYSTKYGDTCEKTVRPKAIIVHYTAWPEKTTAAAVVRDWANPESTGAICQIIVERDGKVYQITDSLEEKVICQGSKNGQNWNTGGIGIEVMAKDENELLRNEAQKQAVINLINNLASHYNIPKTNDVNNLMLYTRGGIFSHQQITRCQDATNQKQDAGERYMRDIFEGIGGIYIDWTNNPDCQHS